MATFDTLYDTFDSAPINAKWTTSGAAPPTVVAGEARLTPTTGNAVSSSTNYLISTAAYDLYNATTDLTLTIKIRKSANAQFYIKIGPSPTGSGNAYVIYNNSATSLRSATYATSLTETVSVTYNATTMAYLRFVYSGFDGYVYSQYSSNGTSWTTLGSYTSQNFNTGSKLLIFASGAAGEYVYVDSVNYDKVPAAAPIKVTVPGIAASNPQLMLPVFSKTKTVVLPIVSGSPAESLNIDRFLISTRSTVIQVPEITALTALMENAKFSVYEQQSLIMPLAKGELAQLKWNRAQYDPVGLLRMEPLETSAKARAYPWGPPETFRTLSFPAITTELSYLKWATGDPLISGRIRLPFVSARHSYVAPWGPERDLAIGLPMASPAYSWLKWNNVDPGPTDPSIAKDRVWAMPRLTTRLISAYPMPVKNGNLKIVLGILAEQFGIARMSPLTIYRSEPIKGTPDVIEIGLETTSVDISVETKRDMEVGAVGHLTEVKAEYHDMDIDIYTQKVTE